MPQEKKICRSDAKHDRRMTIEPIGQAAQSGPCTVFCFDISYASSIEIAVCGMMKRVRTPPDIVRGQSYDS